MRKTSEIKADISNLWENHYKQLKILEDEFKVAKKYKQETCPHPEDKIRIRDDSYFEEGRMSGPICWQEKYCKVCGKVLAKSSSTTTTIWIEV